MTYTIRWQTRTGTGPSNQVDIPTATAPVLTQASYPQAVSDAPIIAASLLGELGQASAWRGFAEGWWNAQDQRVSLEPSSNDSIFGLRQSERVDVRKVAVLLTDAFQLGTLAIHDL